MEKKIKVCYALSYKSPNYVRTTSLVSALSLLENVELFQARNTHKGLFRYLETFIKFLGVRFRYNPDIYIIGFRGHEIYWFLRIFALRKKFIFDEMMSPYDSLVNEKELFKKKSLLMRLMYLIERSILVDADYVLTDTNLHVDFLSKMFDLDRGKVIAIPVGTDENVFDIENTQAKDFGGIFTVFFYGSFLPLHGLDVILHAAKLVQDFPIKFIIVGGRGKEKVLKEFRQTVDELDLKNVEHHEWLDFEELPKYIKGADLCLGGPFGGTPQARRVVNGKTYQFLKMGKITVVGRIEEETGLTDKKNCVFVVQGSSESLASAVEWCYKNREEESVRLIELNARKLFEENFSYKIIKGKLKSIIND